MLVTHAIFLGKQSEFNDWYLEQEGKEFIYVLLKKFIEVIFFLFFAFIFRQGELILFLFF